MVERISFKQALNEMELDRKKPPHARKVAAQYGAFKAREIFKEYADDCKQAANDWKENHNFIEILGSSLDVGVITVFGLVGAVFSATFNAIHGVAAAAIHPRLIFIRPKTETSDSEIEAEGIDEDGNYSDQEDDVEPVPRSNIRSSTVGPKYRKVPIEREFDAPTGATLNYGELLDKLSFLEADERDNLKKLFCVSERFSAIDGNLALRALEKIKNHTKIDGVSENERNLLIDELEETLN